MPRGRGQRRYRTKPPGARALWRDACPDQEETRLRDPGEPKQRSGPPRRCGRSEATWVLGDPGSADRRRNGAGCGRVAAASGRSGSRLARLGLAMDPDSTAGGQGFESSPGRQKAFAGGSLRGGSNSVRVCCPSPPTAGRSPSGSSVCWRGGAGGASAAGSSNTSTEPRCVAGMSGGCAAMGDRIDAPARPGSQRPQPSRFGWRRTRRTGGRDASLPFSSGAARGVAAICWLAQAAPLPRRRCSWLVPGEASEFRATPGARSSERRGVAGRELPQCRNREIRRYLWRRAARSRQRHGDDEDPGLARDRLPLAEATTLPSAQFQETSVPSWPWTHR
jgi:hypothetical protein